MDARAGSRSTTALMYHALGDAPGVGADAHYTVTMPRFEQHIATCKRIGGGAVSARDWLAGHSGVIITFDDGHRTNYQLGFPALVAAGAGADFFVNPAQVGSEGFATWSELREMAEGGMSIQSHGLDHSHYLTELPAPRLRDELLRARQEIEQHVGQPVTLLAPAGGRCPPDLERVAQDVGYTHVLNSRPGGVRSGRGPSLPRFAVTSELDVATLESWLRGGRARMTAELRYSVLAAAKRVLGDRLYERVRERLLGTERTP
jgi:peptidoglycan/xylan/chitin deacetylase (PgdA/CDA1 family)